MNDSTNRPGSTFRCYVAAAGKYGIAHDSRHAMNTARRGIAVKLDGEKRIDFWHADQVVACAEVVS